MSATDRITVGEPLPRLASVVAGGPYEVALTWAEGARVGRSDVVDLAPIILTYKVFRPLREDAAQFRAVRLGEGGRSIVWPDDADLDIGADSLEGLAEETMTNADFAAFLQRHGLTYDAAAAHLGISRRMVAYYAKSHAVPRVLALACRYIDLQADASRAA
ncbi:DUF2442 domain-containing protein [Methylorubrum thiocyanatum]|uniref:DUF2442 domain-containing protein n=1 Tax=Methylorubrum thiocyanatum TaxID=47958 RepID=A0AA40S318_9HYPH|nr:DUF2442 domain-containing protein [Methylorubrum thiocyanatum]MBA8913660.1 hypothetical protein [Methylorubrum thiocyanatum]GJE81551.1 hypothetical protein CJNNKLLH_2903 [Methylorubrum thiocyanatum]